tara:strand:- start:427 stop:615 length:189 start_codon:yes stop_codon:yes gene_type:complete
MHPGKEKKFKKTKKMQIPCGQSFCSSRCSGDITEKIKMLVILFERYGYREHIKRKMHYKKVV